jgi:predicted AlkP superfamily pyrophosphatase or phosphodiesterase
MRRVSFVFAALVAAFAAAPGTVRAQPAAPKLAVVIVVDQFRADYLLTFREHFGADGFERFLSRGAWLTQARYEHAASVTCAGHATVLTGSPPAVTGIIANDWWSREAQREEYCARDDSAPLLGASGEGRSPRNLFGATVGDMLRIATNGASRVVSIAGKDRAAIMLGGRLTDSVYWLEGLTFVSSTYYRQALPEWVAGYNASHFAEQAFGKTWSYALPAAAYAAQGPDDVPAERNKPGLGATFPHVMGQGLASAADEDFVEAFEYSPYANDAVAELAKRAVQAERLGHGAATDVLAIGFSANDRIGHAFGPNSHEVLDVTVRTDRLLADLFAFLDREVGRGNYLAVLTADHGVAPIPEIVNALNPTAGALRLDEAVVRAAVEDALAARFGKRADGRAWVVYHDAPYFYFDEAALAAAGADLAAAEAVAAAAVLKVPGVAVAYTRSELRRQQAAGVATDITLAFHAERGGNVYYVRAPFVLEDDDSDGTTHGTPWNYDRRVPILWYGAGIAPGLQHGAADVRDIAPTLAWLLRVAPPPAATGRVLAEVLR